MIAHKSSTRSRRGFGILAAATIILTCIWLMKSAASFGLSKILSRYSLAGNSLEAATEAVKLTPNDAEAHRARAVVLNNSGLKEDAAKEMELAVSLRPRDNLLWMEVGILRDSYGNTDSALVAFDHSVRLAPYYGHPHWQRGNLLVRLGRYDEGFNELRLAVKSNRDFLSGLIDLAWGMSRGDAQLTEQLVRADDDRTRLAMSRFFAHRGKSSEAFELFRKISTTIPDESRADLVRTLIQSKAYHEAFEVWKSGLANSNTDAIIQDGGFEQELILDQTGFGWQAPKHDSVGFALDVNDPNSGSRSLRITFEGYENHSSVLSQLFLVKPDQDYRVSFAVKTKELVTGGLPVLKLVDANTGEVLGAPVSFQSGSSGWTTMSVNFKTLSSSRAAFIKLERNACSSAPCPIFGHVWLDSLAVEEVSVNRSVK
jgi:tetratricopeptide (TPR) repeat protein